MRSPLARSAGPAFAATHEERCAPPVPLSAALEALFARRTVMKVGHIDLDDGRRVWVEPAGFRRIEEVTPRSGMLAATGGPSMATKKPATKPGTTMTAGTKVGPVPSSSARSQTAGPVTSRGTRGKEPLWSEILVEIRAIARPAAAQERKRARTDREMAERDAVLDALAQRCSRLDRRFYELVPRLMREVDAFLRGERLPRATSSAPWPRLLPMTEAMKNRWG